MFLLLLLFTAVNQTTCISCHKDESGETNSPCNRSDPVKPCSSYCFTFRGRVQYYFYSRDYYYTFFFESRGCSNFTGKALFPCDRHNFGNQTDSKRSYGNLFVPNFSSVRSLWRRSLRSSRSLMSCFYNNRCNRRETFRHFSDRCYHMEITLKNELNVVGGYGLGRGISRQELSVYISSLKWTITIIKVTTPLRWSEGQ